MDSKREYEGDLARSYTERRKHSRKWQFEQVWIEQFLGEACTREGGAVRVADAPSGDSRFHALLQELPKISKIWLIDSSREMLALSQKKVPIEFKLLCHDLLESAPPIDYDLLICSRFLNLIPWDQATIALDHLRVPSLSSIIFTIRSDTEVHEIQDREKRVYVHSRATLVCYLSSNGFEIEREQVFKDQKPGSYSVIWAKRKDRNLS